MLPCPLPPTEPEPVAATPAGGQPCCPAAPATPPFAQRCRQRALVAANGRGKWSAPALARFRPVNNLYCRAAKPQGLRAPKTCPSLPSLANQGTLSSVFIHSSVQAAAAKRKGRCRKWTLQVDTAHDRWAAALATLAPR